MISKMLLMEIVVPRGAFEPALDALQAAGLVHLEEVPMSDPDGVGFLHRVHLTSEQEHERATYADLVEATEGALSFLPGAVRREQEHSAEMKRHYSELDGKSASAIASTARSLHARVRSFARRRRNLAADLSALSSYEAVVAAMAPLADQALMPAHFESNGVVFTREDRKAFKLLGKQLDKLAEHEHVLLDSRTSDGRVVALLGYPKEKAAPVRAFLEKAGISEIRAPRHLRDRPFTEAMAMLEKDIAAMKEKEKQLRVEADEFYRSNAAKLVALARVCHDRLARLDALAKFAKSRYTYVIRGWAPSSRVEHLEQRLRAVCGPTISVRAILPQGTEDPPVLLQNSSPVAPFERLLGLMPLPRYGTADPSAFLAMFFPPMFGLMLGDVGYGLLLAIGAVVLYRSAGRRRLQRELAIVLGYCAFFVCVFGFVFGEAFGTFGHHLGLRPLWRERLSLDSPDRAGAIFGYLAIALGVGVLHIVWGLVVGIMNARRTRNRGHVIDRAARLVGLFALFFIAGWLVQFLPSICLSLGIVSAVIFLALMIQQIMYQPIHGCMLPLELLGTVGNIFSYARIMAVGLASVVLAIVAEQFGNMIGNVALAAIVVVLVHVMNIALGVIDPTIQGLRLHYVEFFSKFYEANGRPYVPFRTTGGTEL